MVQEIGLGLLVRQDAIVREEDRAEDFRIARIAAGESAVEVYPEYFPASTNDDPEDVDLNREGVEYDYSGVTFEGGESAMDDWERMQQAMGDGHVVVSDGKMGWH